MAHDETAPDGHPPNVGETFRAFAAEAFASDGALDLKTKALVAAAVAAALRSPRVMEGHLDRARGAGATEDEAAEALAVAAVQGGGTQVFWMKDDLDDLLGEGWRREHVPDVDRAFWAFKRTAFEDGALPERTKHLVAVAVSSALRCRHCTRAHVGRALEAGASKGEVAEALAVLWAVGSEVAAVWDRAAPVEDGGRGAA